MQDFLGRGVDNENTAKQHYDGVNVKLELQQVGKVHCKHRVLEKFDQVSQYKQQRNAQYYRNADPPFAYLCLLMGGRALRFERDVQQIVEAEHGLKHGQ